MSEGLVGIAANLNAISMLPEKKKVAILFMHGRLKYNSYSLAKLIF